MQVKTSEKSDKNDSKKAPQALKCDIILPNSLIHDWRRATLALMQDLSLEEIPSGEGAKALAITGLIEEFQAEIGGLWESYNTERGDLHKFSLTRRRQAIAYMLAMHLPNTARLYGVLRRAFLRSDLSLALRKMTSIKIIDIGAGGGAMSLAWLHHLQPQISSKLPIDVELVDVSRYLLEAASQQIKSSALQVQTLLRHCKIEELFLQQALATREPDTLLIINLGYVLNEIERNKKARHVFGKLMESIADRPALLCITEPAKQQPSRDMMLLHDDLVGIGMSPLYPCPNALPCPMLQKSRDWCFSELSFKRPIEITKIDQWLGRDTSLMATTGFVYASRSFAKKFKNPWPKDMKVAVGRPAIKLPGNTSKFGVFKYLVCEKGELKYYAKTQTKSKVQLKRGEQF